MCSVVAVFDGSFDGFLTVLYKHYYEKLEPCDLVVVGAQLELGAEYVEVVTCDEQAARAFGGVRAHFDDGGYERLCLAFLCAEEKRYFDIYRYCLQVFKHGTRADGFTHLDYVMNVHHYARSSGHELQLLRGFTRFADAGGGVMYAHIEPKNDVLHPLADFFSDRLKGVKWVIHDVGRGKAALFDGEEFVFTDAPEFLAEVAASAEQDYYEGLWTAFYNAIAIKERTNYKLQRQMKPKYFWKHMVEHNRMVNGEW